MADILIGILIIVVVGVLTFLIVRKKQAKPQNKNKSIYPTNRFKVNGVTFNNDDGTSRQEILKNIKLRNPPYDKNVNVELKKGTYEGKLSIGVYVNDKQIGNISTQSKNKVDAILENIDKLEIDVYGGGKLSDGSDKSFGCKLLIYQK